MRLRVPPWLLAMLVVALCAGALAIALYLRSRTPTDPAELVRYLPAHDAELLLYVDVDALRRAGIVSPLAAVGEEPEYKAFVMNTAFDYRHDLDAVLASFQGKESYFLLRGRFNWKTLRDYVAGQGGVCINGVCRVAGSTPDRTVSFLPLKPDLMALAVSGNRLAATHLGYRKDRTAAAEIPAQPVWAIVPSSALKEAQGLPAGTRLFAQSLETADTMTLALMPDGERYRVVLDANCKTAEDAVVLKVQLEKITDTLRKLIARENQAPNPGDLSGVLTAGSFSRDGRRVRGAWPIEKLFLNSLTGGAL